MLSFVVIFWGQVVLSCSICGMRLQGNRFSGRVPKSVGVPRGPIIQQCTQKSSIAKCGKCGNISLELVLQHSNHQFPSKEQWYIKWFENYLLLGFLIGIKIGVCFGFDSEMHLEISSYEDPRVMLMVSRRNICTIMYIYVHICTWDVTRIIVAPWP